MGNSSTKEARSSSQTQSHLAGVNNSSSTSRPTPTPTLRPSNRTAPPTENPQPPRRRGSRPELTSIFGIGTTHHDADPADPSARKETKAEREQRKLEKERANRDRERERSLREEGVDGGYMVTLGTYTGTEDFNKPIVRQLMIERRLAPFWMGLNDHSSTWTDQQLVAIARGLPLPPADAAPKDEPSNATSSTPQTSDTNITHLTVPITSRSLSIDSDGSSLSPSQAAFSLPAAPSPFGSPPSSSPFFRGRAKTLAALTTSRNNTQSEMIPQEHHLPRDPFVQGRPLEACLYSDASECPICFLYYPPYLNKTRCCDQPICSECFVQIKRPDPHPPEHHDDPDNPHPPEAAENGPHDEYLLVSEPATCPFCKQPEFGITYESPPFRKGLTYGDQHRLASVASAMSSSSSVNSHGHSNGNRRRTTSLGANSPNVITTDRIRPDWAKKLSDARAHALRRAAAATALHNAAYVLSGNNQQELGPRLTFGRRRRTLFGNDGGNASSEGLGFGHMGALMAAADRHGASGSRSTEGQSDLFPGRHSSRRSRIDDLEELMMMEAIRLSLAAEDERKKKEDKEAEKKSKKDEKQRAKDEKKAAKAARKGGSASNSLYPSGMNSSSVSQFTSGEASTTPAGKGKAPDRSGIAGGFNPLTEPTSTINSGGSPSGTSESQRHLAQSRTNIQTPATTGESSVQPNDYRHSLRPLSNASSGASSLMESGGDNGAGSSFEASPNASGLNLDGLVDANATPPGGGAGTEPMFNFRSLAAVIGDEDKDGGPTVEYLEHVPPRPSLLSTHISPAGGSDGAQSSNDGASSSGGGGGSLTLPTGKPNRPLSTGEKLFGVAPSNGNTPPMIDSVAKAANSVAQIGTDTGSPLAPQESNPYDMKHYGDISVLDQGHFGTPR
ncbi:hypothetical protein EJ08DRAFT_406388 [Tothia fuscella]|uniref:Protein sip5 n=1 Tax=Tothia fuscella TaxID=1048955 RepID=A0A9P4NKG3_9PEZI|nr:hypothetical protein EJ08DRAFT_406388 [Tothia fuscella]